MSPNYKLQYQRGHKLVPSNWSYQHLLDLHAEGRSSAALCWLLISLVTTEDTSGSTVDHLNISNKATTHLYQPSLPTGLSWSECRAHLRVLHLQHWQPRSPVQPDSGPRLPPSTAPSAATVPLRAARRQAAPRPTASPLTARTYRQVDVGNNVSASPCNGTRKVS